MWWTYPQIWLVRCGGTPKYLTKCRIGRTCICNHRSIINTIALIHGANLSITIFNHLPNHFLQSFIATNTTYDYDISRSTVSHCSLSDLSQHCKDCFLKGKAQISSIYCFGDFLHLSIQLCHFWYLFDIFFTFFRLRRMISSSLGFSSGSFIVGLAFTISSKYVNNPL